MDKRKALGPGASNTPVKVRPRAPPRVEQVSLPDPRKPEGADAAMPSLTAGIGVGRNAPGSAPPLEATVYDLEAHPDAIAKALDDPSFQTGPYNRSLFG